MKPKQLNRRRQRYISIPLLWGVALILCISTLWGQKFLPMVTLDALIILALAIISELRPVHFERDGFHLILSMPFLIGLLVIGGPIAFVVAEASICITAILMQYSGQKRKMGLRLITLNLPISLISSCFAVMSYSLVQRISNSPREWVFATVIAVAVYEFTNCFSVLLVNSISRKSSVSGEFIRSYKTILAGVIVLIFVALATASLIHEKRVVLLPVLLAPILMLRKLAKEQMAIDNAGYETMVTLTLMLQRAHPYSHGHLGRVGLIAEEVGQRLGISHRRSRLLREAAVLHDIGKIAIDEKILDKPAKLTDEEYEHVKLHASYGAEILQGSKRFKEIVPWIRFHHERPDGRGYPSQLSDIEIPLESKIISVADAFDAMVGTEHEESQRSYRVPKTIDEGLAELERCSGTQFDPSVVAAFKEVILSAR